MEKFCPVGREEKEESYKRPCVSAQLELEHDFEAIH